MTEGELPPQPTGLSTSLPTHTATSAQKCLHVAAWVAGFWIGLLACWFTVAYIAYIAWGEKNWIVRTVKPFSGLLNLLLNNWPASLLIALLVFYAEIRLLMRRIKTLPGGTELHSQESPTTGRNPRDPQG